MLLNIFILFPAAFSATPIFKILYIFFCLSKPLYTSISLLEQHECNVRNRNELRQCKTYEGPQNIEEISSGAKRTRVQSLLVVCCSCKHVSLHTRKAYLLLRVRVFEDRRVSSEDNIVAIFDVITAVLLNIFGLLYTLLKALESSAQQSSIGPKTA